jgi:hypothetical protein
MGTMVFVLAALAALRWLGAGRGGHSASGADPEREGGLRAGLGPRTGRDEPPRGEPAVRRNNRGVVYHRQQGTNWGTDAYFLP